MKRVLLLLAVLFVAVATAEAQGLGQLYDDGRVRGIVVKLAPDGQPAVLMSIEPSVNRSDQSQRTRCRNGQRYRRKSCSGRN